MRQTAPRRPGRVVSGARAAVVTLRSLNDPLTWNQHLLYQHEALEFMGLPLPAVNLGFGFLDAPAPRAPGYRARQQCKGRAPVETLSLLEWQPSRLPLGNARQARFIGRHPMPPGERAEMLKAERMLRSLGIYPGPPDTYGECPPPGESCGYVSCRHHLGLNVDDDDGGITLTYPVPDSAPSRRHLTDRLSPRDQQIKAMIDRGRSNAEIGAVLGMRARAVKRVRYRLLVKFAAEPELDITAMPETCSLRVADQGPQSLERVATLMRLDPTWLSKLEAAARERMKAAMLENGGYGK